MSEILYPAFLTEEIAERAVNNTLLVIESMQNFLPHMMCHIVILVPVMNYDQDDYPNHPIEPSVLYEYSLGDPKKWPHNFASIARCKALQLWHDRNDGRTDCMPHLLFFGDTPFWGGVKRRGIVVACSGFQPHFDKMFSGIIADMCIGMAYDRWAKVKKDFKEDFLPKN